MNKVIRSTKTLTKKLQKIGKCNNVTKFQTNFSWISQSSYFNLQKTSIKNFSILKNFFNKASEDTNSTNS